MTRTKRHWIAVIVLVVLAVLAGVSVVMSVRKAKQDMNTRIQNISLILEETKRQWLNEVQSLQQKIQDIQRDAKARGDQRVREVKAISDIDFIRELDKYSESMVERVRSVE